MGAGSGISGKRALSSLRVCSTVRNILPPQDGLILRPSHAAPDGRRAASEMSDNVQLFPWKTRDGLWAGPATSRTLRSLLQSQEIEAQGRVERLSFQ